MCAGVRKKILEILCYFCYICYQYALTEYEF